MLTFHLAGINNQNFLMRDEETGSFWQQISGQAVSGPMKGRQLPFIHSDELTFATWRSEAPQGTVLLPVASFEKEYEPKDWERRMAKARTVVDTRATGRAPRELMLCIAAFGGSRAFPLERVLAQKLVLDQVRGEPIVLVVGEDGRSVRAFRARLPDGATPGFFRPVPARSGVLFLDESGRSWNFQGCAVEGAAPRPCLEPVPMLKDYWFDWHQYHPATTVYQR